MNTKKAFLFPLSLLVLAACGQQPAQSSPSGGVSSSEAPVVSTESGGGGGTSSTSGGGGGSSASDSGGGSSEDTKSFAGIVRIYFHNDTGTEKNKRIYVWCDGVDGQEYNWTGDWVDGTKNNGVYYDMDLSDSKYAGFVTDHISFIIKNPSTWVGQSSDIVVKFTDYASSIADEDGKKIMSVYTCPGEGNAIETYTDKTDALGDSFKSFAAKDWSTFTLEGSGTISEYKLYCFDEQYYKDIASGRMDAYERAELEEAHVIKTATGVNKATVDIALPSGQQIDPQKTYRVSGKFTSNPNKTKKKAATFDKLYDTTKFNSDYTYTGSDLGVKYSKDKTEFRVWAPTSTRVRLKVFMYGTPSAYTANPEGNALIYDSPIELAWLTKQAGGVYSGTLTGDYKNMYYTYELYYNEGSYETVDPYATACGVNGLRSAIVDFSETNPEGWDTLNLPVLQPNALTAYEVHVRDFTADDTWVSTKQGDEATPRGTYNAFVEEGTKYNNVPTGFDHLKDLGVNAVQVLPVFDQDNDERTLEKEATLPDGSKKTISIKPGYNWGYNPQNYNCVEGAYSTNPEDAAVRIKEYKNMILKLGKAGIRTIMDVVYNHMSSVSKAPFTTTCPRYFFRYDANQNLIDDTGCSNAVHTERKMVRKYIVDSLKWWVSEYKVAGFRFDLMGCIDVETMRQAKDANPNTIMYGEGWAGSMSGAHMLLGGTAATSGNVYTYLGDKGNGKGSVGCFNDAGRDGAKGNDGSDKAPEVPGNNGEKCWIDSASNVNNVYNTLTMAVGENRWAKPAAGCDPRQTVNYLACHDNYTLYDQINYQFEYFGDKNYQKADNEWAMKACVDLTAFSLFGQGIGFIHGGDEFFRQKLMHADDENLKAMQESYHIGSYYHEDTGVTDTWQEGDGVPLNAAKTEWLVRNSYKYGDAVNAFQWDKLADATVAKYYAKIKEAVALRNAEIGNCLGQSKADIDAGKTWCWDYNDLFDGDGNSKTTIIAAGYIGSKDSKGVYCFVNKGNENAQIGIGNGSFTVLYSSTGRSGNFTVSDNLTPKMDQFECLIVRRNSGAIK